MQREIKFRAWDKINKSWVATDGVKMCDISTRAFESGSVKEATVITLGETWFEYCQFTGTKDKNGVEIYEGDIVTYDFMLIHETKVVVFSNGCFEFADTWLDGFGNRKLSNDTEFSEVIGNIFENPELIKGDK